MDVNLEETSQEVGDLLRGWSNGDQDALVKLMPLVCDELRMLARRQLHREGPGHTLQPTALVNEVYLRLHACKKVNWKNSAHFFGFAAQTMRRILVDHARTHLSAKRGDGARPLPLDEAVHFVGPQNIDLIALNEALISLDAMDPRQARIVELRFFVGLTVEETAEVLEISTATVKREWAVAKAWLFREIHDSAGPS